MSTVDFSAVFRAIADRAHARSAAKAIFVPEPRSAWFKILPLLQTGWHTREDLATVSGVDKSNISQALIGHKSELLKRKSPRSHRPWEYRLK